MNFYYALILGLIATLILLGILHTIVTYTERPRKEE